MEHFPIPEYAKGNPDENHGNVLLRSAIVMACLSPIAVALRFLSRRLTKVPLLADDWLILAALPFAMIECAIDIYGPVHNNFGRHLQFSTPASLRRFFQTTFAFELAYNFAIVLPKFSMLALYWRVFGLSSFKWPLITTATATLFFFLGCTFTAIFACTPVSDYWNNPLGGHCLNHGSYYIGQAVCNITLDIVLMLLPIIPIRRLQMSTSQKIAVSGIFFIGAFVTLCSGLRLNKLVNTSAMAAIDPTFALVDAAVWSVIETNLSVVCVCLPSMRPLLKVVLHGRLRSAAGSSAHHSTNRRSFYDSTIAANSKRRSQVTPSRQGISGISKEQRTDVHVADGADSDVELGYFATVTAHNDRSESGRDKEIDEELVQSDTSSTREYKGGKRTRFDSERLASRNGMTWMRRTSSESVEGAKRQQPTSWPLGLSSSGQKDLD